MMSRPLAVPALALVVLALSAGAAMAHGPSHHGPGGGACSQAHRRQIREVVEDYLDVINERDTSQFSQVFSQDYLLVSTAGTFEGLPAVEGVMSAVYTALPDVHYELDELLIDGNKAVLRYTYTGTHLGDFLGIPATGNTVTCSGLEIDVIEDGYIVETRNFTDYHCLLTGLGAL